MLIKWVGPERLIKYGKASPNELIIVPDRVGQSYINQKLAKKVETIPDREKREVKK